MSKLFDIKVKLKEDYKKCLIFDLDSRLPIGIILGFLGYRHEVMPFLQRASHKTRAFIINANGLPGFIS